MCAFTKKKKKKSVIMSYKEDMLLKFTLIMTQLFLSQRKPAVDSHVKTQVGACGTLAQLQTEHIKPVGQLAGL